MTNNFYLDIFFIILAMSSIFYLFFYFRSGKNEDSSKIVLKNLLESLDMDLPDELKSLDNSSTDPQKFT